MVALTKERKAELRAKKSLETGDTSFKPRGEANKALFEKMKEEFDKKAKDINLHTSSEADRIIKEITPVVTLFSGCDSTNPQDRVNARILQNAANNKANKEDRVLIREQKEKAKAEAKGKAKAKAKKPAASSATASTAAPSEQLESEGEPMKNQSSDSDESSDEDLPMENQSSDSGESSEEEEPMPQDSKRICVRPDEAKPEQKKPAATFVPSSIDPGVKVVWSETCNDQEKKNLRKPISDVTALLKDCKTLTDVKSTFERPQDLAVYNPP